MNKSQKEIILTVLIVGAIAITFILGDFYFTEDGRMTDEQKIALLSEELGLSSKYIQYYSNADIKTINGDYIAEFGKDENGAYIIKSLVKN